MKAIVVCIKPEQLLASQVPDSVVRWCSICGTEVAVAPSTQHLLDEGADPTCWDCAQGLGQAMELELTVSDRQREELNAVGMSDEEIACTAAWADRQLREGGKL